ncbi:oligopeptide/dipeptide ABC transporter, ATP-binding, C-terminal domain protein [Nocardiopsis alba ATCC BAA-2165]|uniref:Oligopeptide/dipeptide ABC transporter, ATP-binding, C-terminal domain protein n=1 Tax=Nocardiopsis alba (strain ATCC BAA-2165 / BE74) TaxID=1205910 RepID=J7L7K8_NOCAA|nr:oligopeptide/dipeptide ABC transporter, ATP-binding, C-terminal domain protein [Nocardiopsis alba ATCC BAA-2165]
MRHGQAVERGDVRKVLSEPEHAYTQALLDAVPRVEVSRALERDKRQGKVTEAGDFKAFTPAEDEDRGEPLLRVRDVAQRFKVRGGMWGRSTDFWAVKGVGFDLYKGETLGVVGESGSGKSTLSRMIMRLLEPTEGTVEFEGQDITHLSEHRLRPLRRDIQMVFQNPYSSLNPRLTIGESIGTALKVQGERDGKKIRSQVQELLARVGLEPDHYNRFPHAFSGGQRQRIAIARALILKPKLIICDEPVSALDVSTQDQVLRLLSELQDDFGLTYIFVAHCKGEVVEMGDSDSVYENPQSDYTRRLLTAAPILDPDEARRLRSERHAEREGKGPAA